MTRRELPQRGVGDALDLALVARRALPPPPPPPFRERIEPALDARNPSRARRGMLAVTGAGLAAAALVIALTRPSPDAAVCPFTVESGAAVVRPDGVGRFVATGPAKLSSRTSEITLEAGARVSFETATKIWLESGRAGFHVMHPVGEHASSRAPFQVDAGSVVIEDRGTTFSVDVAPTSLEDGRPHRVLVTVTEGSVSAAGVELPAGRGLAFLAGRPSGPAWPLDARPSLALEAESAALTAGEPVVLRILLANPTDGWIPWPVAGDAQGPLHVEVTDPFGAVTPVRVTNSMLADGSAGHAIPPRGQSVLRVRFDRTFASPGTYRLRAIFRPAEAVEDPASASISLTVRPSESGSRR